MTPGGSGDWQLAVGDPTWLGWFTAAAYVAAACLCVRAARAPGDAELGSRRLAGFWLLLALLLLALGENKQLDVQTFVIERLRDLARAEGWYAQRRRYQRLFVAVCGGASIAALCALGVALRPVWPRVRLGLLGLAVLLGFVLLRAAVFQRVGPVWLAHSEPLHAWLELLGIGVLGWAALRAVVRQPEAPG